MDSLPEEVMREIFSHLGAFDAQRFGMASWKARKVILAERKLVYVFDDIGCQVPKPASLYTGWIQEVMKEIYRYVDYWVNLYVRE